MIVLCCLGLWRLVGCSRLCLCTVVFGVCLLWCLNLDDVWCCVLSCVGWDCWFWSEFVIVLLIFLILWYFYFVLFVLFCLLFVFSVVCRLLLLLFVFVLLDSGFNFWWILVLFVYCVCVFWCFLAVCVFLLVVAIWWFVNCVAWFVSLWVCCRVWLLLIVGCLFLGL